MWKECPRGTTAFDPANRLTFAGGPMPGIKQTGAAKWTAGGISPSFNMNADSSVTHAIRDRDEGDRLSTPSSCTAGAEKPVYIVVEDGKAKIKDARKIWGKDAYETEDMIKDAEGAEFRGRHHRPGRRTAGPLRQHPDRARNRFSGAAGWAAVMGSKLLKGIAVRGIAEMPDSRPGRASAGSTRRSTKRLAELDAAQPELLQFKRLGTAGATELFAPQGNLPIKNYPWPASRAGRRTCTGRSTSKKLNAKPWPCKYCVIQCHNQCEIKKGPYAYKGKGPEYESFAMMGFNTMVDDIEAVAYACELANLYSMDCISLGGDHRLGHGIL